MNKRISLILVLMLVLMLGVSCKENESKQISVEEAIKMADSLNNSNAFSTKLVEVNEKVVMNSYKITDKEAELVFSNVGEGVSAEEITIFKGNKQKIKEIVDRYLNEKEELYKSYLPEETGKIQKAIVKQYGDITIVCICDDIKAAEDIIK